MSQLYLIAILLVLAAAAGAGYWFFLRWRQNRWLDEALSSELLGSWTYTPAEWRQAVADEFSWGKTDVQSAQIFIYPSLIYLKADTQRRFFALERDGRVVTFAGFSGIEGSPLKIRVRWKVIHYDKNGVRQETKYYKDDFRIPVPAREKGEAEKVVEFLMTRLENNLAAYTDVVPDDEPISLFGKDQF